MRKETTLGSDGKLPVKTGCQKTERNKGQDVNDRQKAIIGKHLGNFSVCVLPAGSSLTRRGQWSEVEKKRGDREREKEIQRLKEGKGEGELHSSLCSLNEVFFLFLCVRMVALSVDDGCVGVGRIIRPFGLVCQVCSFMPGQVSSQNND